MTDRISFFHCGCRKIFVVLFAALQMVAYAETEIDVLQTSLNRGHAEEVLQKLNAALKNDPENPHLLYNRAIAFYAAKRFEDALVDLDLVENSRFRALANKARFQKGNAEFQLGLARQQNDAEFTVVRWKQSLENYKALLKEKPADVNARNNYDRVRQMLLELLMKTAQENLRAGKDVSQPPEQRIQSLRAAMEQFHEAVELDPKNEAARQGEAEARELLAQLLAEEGTRKTMANQLVLPAPNEPAIPRPDIPQIQEGVNMLEDAKDLKPADQNIAKQLEQGKQRLADALTLQASIYLQIEPQIQRFDEKQAILRLAMDTLNRALDQVPEHQRAKELLEQVKKRLAEVHEQQGDQLSQQSENAELEQQASQLSQALDHFQQASDLQPQQSQLQSKAQQAQSKLEEALEKLADKLMQKPGAEGEESMEGEAARLEGALQALNELQGLKPGGQAGEKARGVGEQLEALRQKMGASKKPGESKDGSDGTPQSGTKDSQTAVPPMDAPPRFDTTGTRGRYHSSALNRSLRDY